MDEFRQFRSARELALIGLIAVAENLGCRQLNTLWRLRGLVDYWRGSGGWDAFSRKALGEIS